MIKELDQSVNDLYLLEQEEEFDEENIPDVIVLNWTNNPITIYRLLTNRANFWKFQKILPKSLLLQLPTVR